MGADDARPGPIEKDTWSRARLAKRRPVSELIDVMQVTICRVVEESTAADVRIRQTTVSAHDADVGTVIAIAAWGRA